MRNSLSKKELILAFKQSLQEAAKGSVDLEGMYTELKSSADELLFFWSLNCNWFVEAELYDAENVYKQRRVVTRLAPGDFFVLPQNLPHGMKLFARSFESGNCHYGKIENFVDIVTEPNLLQIVGNKFSYALTQLSEFEKKPSKPSLIRPEVLKPDRTTKLGAGRKGIAVSGNLWVERNDLNVSPKPLSDEQEVPGFVFLHDDFGVENLTEQVAEVTSIDSLSFFSRPDIIFQINAQFEFYWSELSIRWSDQLSRVKQSENEYSARNDVFTQSVRSRLLNLLTGKKSFIPDTSNHLLRSAFFLINENGWIPNIPKSTEDEDADLLLGKIADSSGLIIRKTSLKGKWWVKDSGSFIAFRKDGTPLVLFFKKGSYQKWESIKNNFSELTQADIDGMSKRAIYFYNQLPAQPLSLLDLVFFELHLVRKEILLVLIIALTLSGLIAFLPLVSAFVVNVLLPSALTDLLAVACFGLVVIGIFQTLFTWFDTMLMTRIDYKLSLASTAALWHRVLHFPSNVLRQNASGDIAMRIDSCLGMQKFFRIVGQKVITMSFQLFSSLAVVFWVHFDVGLGVLAFGLFAVVAAFAFTYWQIRAFTSGEKSLGIVNSYILEMYSGIHKIKAAAVEDECLHQWAERYSRLRKKLLSSQRVRIIHSSFQAAWVTLTTALVYWLIVGLGNVDLEPALFIAFLGAFAVFSANLSTLCSIVVQSGIQVPMYKFIKLLLEKVPDCKSDMMVPENISGNLRADRISYLYPGQNTAAVQQVSLSIKQGSFAVIVGESGSGKSTLGKLLAGLDQPTNGHVFLDDYELNTLDPVALRSNIAMVPQDFRLINGTLYENIMGAASATEQDVISATKAACIWDDISELPMRLHTLTGTQFGAFSGGQIQRIALARALVRKPCILIMDEATSALDNSLQEKIISNLKAMNSTIIFVAHRLKIAKHADQVFVMQSGEIVERGTHEELLSYEKFYAKMWRNVQ